MGALFGETKGAVKSAEVGDGLENFDPYDAVEQLEKKLAAYLKKPEAQKYVSHQADSALLRYLQDYLAEVY